MKRKIWFYSLFGSVIIQLALAFPSIAKGPGVPPAVPGEYNFSDIALSPGADITELNFNWHTNTALTGDGTKECAVEIAGKRNQRNKYFFNFANFPKNSRIFYGTKASAGTDENGVADYYCEVEVSKLQDQMDYVYRVGEGKGSWSDIYEYATRNKNKYGFFFTPDPQIGASKKYENANAKEDIAETMARREYPLYTDDQIQAIVDDYVPDAQITDDTDLYLSNEILALYTLYKQNSSYLTGSNFTKARLIKYFLTGKGYVDPALTDITNAFNAGTLTTEPVLTWLTNLVDDYDTKDLDGDLQAAAQACYDVIATNKLAVRTEAANADTEKWLKTVEVMTDKFPRAAFIMTSGDQVENSWEYEWTGFFSADELTSLPVAPAIGSHDAGANFGYHFNLPNESTAYGVDKSGGDYYFTYGNVLYMVLNMDKTMNLFPRSAPPPPPSGGGGPPPEQTCEGIDDDATFAAALALLEATATDDTTDDPSKMKLDDFKASIYEHEDFMNEAIAANPNVRWTVVNWHYSIYSAGNHGAEDVIRAIRVYMFPILDDLDIDLVLLAHDHVYTRTFQMFDDDPQENQMVGKKGEIINPTGTLYLTGSTSSGSKYYSLNVCYDIEDDPETTDVVEGPDPYYEYVALGDDMSRTDNNGTPDDATDDKTYNMPNFTYIDIDNNSLKLSSFSYRTDEDTGDYTMELVDTYTMVKHEPPKPPYKIK